MQIFDGQLFLSASDLINFLECMHLTRLNLDLAEGRIDGPPKRRDIAKLAARKGDAYERKHLGAMRAEYSDELVEIDTSDRSFEGIRRAAAQTREAMEQGASAIYQAAFMQDGWMGFSDFLERVDDE